MTREVIFALCEKLQKRKVDETPFLELDWQPDRPTAAAQQAGICPAHLLAGGRSCLAPAFPPHLSPQVDGRLVCLRPVVLQTGAVWAVLSILTARVSPPLGSDQGLPLCSEADADALDEVTLQRDLGLRQTVTLRCLHSLSLKSSKPYDQKAPFT